MAALAAAVVVLQAAACGQEVPRPRVPQAMPAGVALAADGLMPVGGQCPAGVSRAAGKPTPQERRRAVDMLDLSPAVFVKNDGQWDEHIRYGFHGRGVNVLFTDSGPVFQLTKREGEGEDASFKQAVFSAHFVGAKAVSPEGLERSGTKKNFFLGNDPAKWQKNVPTFKKMAYRGLYDGVDLYAWGRRSGLKYEFHIAPGASWKQIAVRYEGAKGLWVDDAGALHVPTAVGEMVDEAPLVYQEAPSGRVEVAAHFRLVDEDCFGFDITGSVDPLLPLVIDPTLVSAIFFGGTFNDEMHDLAVDPSGNVWVTGYTCSVDFPTPGGFDTTYGGYGDAFVAKISPAGELVWASYLSGNSWQGDDYGYAIAVDPSGNVWVTGITWCTDFPTPGGFDTTHSDLDWDVFIVKITPSGELAWGSYLGGEENDYGWGIAVDEAGNVFVTGMTASPDFPVSDPLGKRPCNLPGTFDEDVFLVKIRPYGVLEWACCYGGETTLDYWSKDVGSSLALDSFGNIWLTGYTRSSDFPTPGGFDTTLGDDLDAFVAKVSPSGELAWASYLGGSTSACPELSANDYGTGIAVDAAGNAWVTGYTYSVDFPTPGGFDTTLGGEEDAFVAKISAAGELAWASYLGGEHSGGVGREGGYDIAVDCYGNVWVAGGTNCDDFPTAGGLETGWYGGKIDCFVAKLTQSGELEWTGCFGGSKDEAAVAVGIAGGPSNAGIWVAGDTYSADFPGRDVVENSCSPFVVSIELGPPVITTETLARGYVGDAYSDTLKAVIDYCPGTWMVISGSLPDGLSLDPATGEIHGVPTAEGTSVFTAQVADSHAPPQTDAKELSIRTVIESGGPVISSAATVPSFVREGIDLSVSLTATADDTATGDSTVVAAEHFTGPDVEPGTGTSMQAADGAFDTSLEGLVGTVDTSAWCAGLVYTVGVRAKDAYGYWGPVTVVEVPAVDGTPPGAVTDLAATALPTMEKLAATVADCSGSLSSAGVSNLLDGDSRTFWQTAGTEFPETEYLVLDAGCVMKLAGVSLAAGRLRPLFPSSFRIEVSEGGGGWTRVASAERFRAGAKAYFWQFDPVEARYVKVSGPGMRLARDKRYYWQMGEAALYESISSRVGLSWSAPGDDAYAGGPASQYDLRYSLSPISASNFDACARDSSVAAPGPTGTPEETVVAVGDQVITAYLALKTGDEVPNWSDISNVLEVPCCIGGFIPALPVDGSTQYARIRPRFEFYKGADIRSVRIVFSSSEGFVSRPTARPDGQVDRTLKFPIGPMYNRWQPKRGPWKRLKKMVCSENVLWWRLEGKSRVLGTVFGPARYLYFECGEVGDLTVSPSHVLGADEAVWPDAGCPPEFSWRDDTQWLKYFFVDVSTLETIPLKDARHTTTLSGRGILRSPCTATAAEWKRVRRLASTAGGRLYWRVRVLDEDRALTYAGQVKVLVVDGGTWSVSSPEHDPATGLPVFTWEHYGEGICRFALEFSADEAFEPSPRHTLVIPSRRTAGTSYTLVSGELKAVKRLAARSGTPTLYYRVRGEDADGTFITHSPSETWDIP
ncbi:MAG: SBBP repeat-containing protein [Planctomycetes bacterium]|nr:SBBP repeat-containing protein [Planctomycetota bacterium]